MGMTIEEIIEFFNGLECHTPQAKDAKDIAVETMRKYQQLQASYENRLKADMVAMLEELKSEIEEEAWYQGCQSNECAENEAYTIRNLIQEKIDSLKIEPQESKDKE